MTEKKHSTISAKSRAIYLAMTCVHAGLPQGFALLFVWGSPAWKKAISKW